MTKTISERVDLRPTREINQKSRSYKKKKKKQRFNYQYDKITDQKIFSIKINIGNNIYITYLPNYNI